MLRQKTEGQKLLFRGSDSCLSSIGDSVKRHLYYIGKESKVA